MVKINKKLEYALIILAYMSGKTGTAEQPESSLVCAKEVCSEFHLSFDVASKVMQTLAQHEVLRSVKGAHGGYVLEKTPDQVSLFDLNTMIVGPIAVTNCLHEEGECELSGSCNIIAPMQSLNEKVEGLYRQIRLSDLFSEKQPLRFENEEKVIRKKSLSTVLTTP